ncbi:MAG: hypothetical protein NC412_03460 [Roseburia sp.]|nr:hypothetical protein [Roseburia sp.]MCM1278770.1 hypothetical protein [Robinsoniella sp.]
MECTNLNNNNLIKFLPIKKEEQVLFLDSIEKIPEDGKAYDWIFVLPYEEKEQDVPRLRRLLDMLTKRGRLYLAAENPFSLHRISGEAEEDGSFFQAFLPEGFEKSKGMSLPFLTAQAKAAIRQCGQEYSLKVYYPYPDIHFPIAVYTDEYLPKPGECDENFYNFHQVRFEFFDERQAVEQIVKAGAYAQFANGYLLEIAREHTNLLYCRYSVERAADKRILTSILKEENGEKIVEKSAFEEASNEHIKKLCHFEERLMDQLEKESFLGRPMSVNRIIKSGQVNGKEQISFPFVKGKSLESCLDDYLKKGEFESCKETLLDFCRMIRGIKGQIPFTVTEEFTKVFGMVELGAEPEETIMSLPVTDIDMVCQNILLGEQITLIDYEWSFAFPIPIDYLIYRVLFCYLEQKDRRASESFDNSFDFYGQAGISPARKKILEQMETHFQKYAQGDCRLLRDLYMEHGKPVVPMSALEKELTKAEDNKVTIQYNMGQGFLEEGFERILKQEENGAGSLVLDLPKEASVQEVKISFGEESTMVRIGLLQEDEIGSKEIAYETNGISVNPILYFYKEKPWISISGLKPQISRLYISLQIVKLPEAFVVEAVSSLSDMREIIANREEQIANYENSTSWKLTKPLRMFFGKKPEG